jgi:hypothetical protein
MAMLIASDRVLEAVGMAHSRETLELAMEGCEALFKDRLNYALAHDSHGIQNMFFAANDELIDYLITYCDAHPLAVRAALVSMASTHPANVTDANTERFRNLLQLHESEY